MFVVPDRGLSFKTPEQIRRTAVEVFRQRIDVLRFTASALAKLTLCKAFTEAFGKKLTKHLVEPTFICELLNLDGDFDQFVN